LSRVSTICWRRMLCGTRCSVSACTGRVQYECAV
jgi:hypothetical protein